MPAIWGGVPQRNKNFTGRTEILSRLRQGLSSKITAVIPHTADQPDTASTDRAVRPGSPGRALQGFGGVGKTALAIEYAHRYRSEYELVWWIPADQPALVRSSLAALAGPLGLPSALGMGTEEASTAVLDALRRGAPYKRWLLVFDNADEPEHLNAIIPRGPGDVLITSRNHRWKAVVGIVPVDVFTREESTEFLAKRVPGGLSATEADLLAAELGDLPLALEQAGALQAETGMSVDEYLRLLKQHAGQILAEGKSTEYPLSMTAAWRLSVATLSSRFPQAMELLRTCAFFGPEPIPQDIFRPGSLVAGTRIHELIADPILLSRAIRELWKFALVRRDGRAISIHRLIQALIRDALTDEEQAAYRHEVHVILAGGAPQDPDDNTQWQAFGDLVAHVSAGATGLAECSDRAVRAFALDVTRYLYRSGDRLSARTFADRFVDRWTEISGPEDPDVLSAQLHLGDALRDLGEYSEAYDLDSSTLEHAHARLGERDPLSLALTRGVAADLRARGDFVAARKRDEEALRLHEAVFGPDHAATLRVMHNLALDYGLTSDYEKARSLQERTLNKQREARGSSVTTTDILISWSGLARAVRRCGFYPEARDVGEDAYEYGREKLGAEHPWTLRALTDLGIALCRSGDQDEAYERAKEAYDLSSRRFGEKHPDTLAAAISLANILRVMGNSTRARELVEATVALYPATYGPDHPYSRACEGNLALMLRVTGDTEKARELNQSALAALKSQLGGDHHYVLMVSTNLASDLAKLGEPAKAVKLGRDTLERSRRVLGESHPLTLGCAANLVVDLDAAGQSEEAESLYEQTCERYSATLGPNHPDAENAAGRERLDFDFDPPPI